MWPMARVTMLGTTALAAGQIQGLLLSASQENSPPKAPRLGAQLRPSTLALAPEMSLVELARDQD